MITAFAENKTTLDEVGEEAPVVEKEPAANLPSNCGEHPQSEAETESDTEQKGFLRRASRLRTKISSIEDMCSPLTPDGAQKKGVRRSKEATPSSTTTKSSISSSVPTPNASNMSVRNEPVVNASKIVTPEQQIKKWRIVHTACHSVLAVLRADPRYVNQARFSEELTVSEVYGHPVHIGIQELLHKLQQKPPLEEQHDSTFYLDVFCEAVKQNDISAAVTGACLSVLHTFLMLGYIDGIDKIANSLIHCAFEESEPHDDSTILVRRRLPASAPSTRGLYRGLSQHFQQDSLFYDNDEQVVHKLLALCVLMVKTTLRMHGATTVDLNGLLHTCWHVRFANTASLLLKHVAGSACQEIVAAIFGADGLTETKCSIVEKLAASLVVDDTTSPEVVALQALQLATTALERTHRVLSGIEIETWNAFARGVLEVAASASDCIVLAHCCRVFYLLLDVNHLKYLKCELEVFLQSVHLRRLVSNSSNEEKEVAIESLLELCYGNKNTAPLNTLDLYLNYDCDGACTNIFEAIVQALGRTAFCPYDLSNEGEEVAPDLTTSLASANSTPSGTFQLEKSLHDNGGKTEVQPINTGSIKPLQTVTAHAQVNHLNRLALEGILSILDDIAKRCVDSISDSGSGTGTSTSISCAMENDSEECSSMQGSSITVPVSEEILEQRKLRKQALAEVVDAFNTGNPDKGEWLQLAVAKGLLTAPDISKDVAELFYKGKGFDKRRMGIYLSRGPVQNFPFHDRVRSDFAHMHDFADLPFAVALRKYLSKFRLPGEAQCIDRLMEAFSKELYRQQGEVSFFKNSDAVYVLAFSTIMLNTDLHNPTIKTDKRMTKEQFVRNNRGINGGEDIPEDFLSDLYDHIKANELQVRQEAGEYMKQSSQRDNKLFWEAVVAKKEEVEPPVHLSSTSGTRRRGVLDRNMFLIVTKSCVKAIAGIFTRSWDDALVVRTLQGLQQVVKVAAYFDLDSVVNDVLQVLLKQGRNYITNCITIDESSAMDGGASIGTPTITRNTSTESTVCEDETTFGGDADHQLIPFGLLCSSQDRGEVDVTGSASNRGLLALDSSFVLLRKYSKRVKDAWPMFIECLSSLRDCRALPAGLSDLDDFADSNGNVLPLSAFAKASQRRLDDYQRSLTDKDLSQNKGWFRSFFRKGKVGDQNDADGDDNSIAPKPELSLYAKTLLSVAESANVEEIIQMGSSQLPDETIHKLLDDLDAFPFENDPVGEQHAVFSLELAARALLSNRSRSSKLFLFFLSKFESILCKVKEDNVPAPFVIERVVVTILRSSIHLYELPELRAHLRSSLQLILMTLPRDFIKIIADRMACGLAIILRSSFHLFQSPNEWTFMGDTLDLLANYSSSRVFVFDGIASTVEYALPHSESQHDSKDNSDTENEKVEERPQLSAEASAVLSRILTRFVLGFYQGDVALTVPAMLCLEKVYRHKVILLLREQAKNADPVTPRPVDPISAVPDKEVWQNVTVAVYSVCRSTDPEASRDGMECFRRIILRTAVNEISDEKWIAILYLMVSKQPPTAAESSRGNTFCILGHLLTKVLPGISYNEENREDLEDLVKQTAALAEENLRHERRGILFERTMQTLTHLSNQLVSDDFGGNKDFNIWANEIFLQELDRVGDVGGKKPATTTRTAVEADDVSEISDSVAEDDDGSFVVEVSDPS